MKRKFVLLMMLFVLLLSSIANADGGEDASLLPNDILQILSGTEWSSYKVGRVNCGSSLADYYSDACCWYDQYGHAAAFVLMHSENKNVLCLFEKNSAGKWVLKAKSSEIVKQGERIPLITSEEYGIYYVSYIDDDRKSELSLEIEKKKDGWYVTRINWDKDNVFMELSLYENKIEYLKIVYANGGSKSTRTTVEGVTPPTSFAEFSLDNIPMTPEKARAQLSLPPDIPQATGEYSLPQPQNIKFTSNKKYAVYSGPGENYFRGGNGKAAVSTNDWIQVFGRENGWIMLQYDITSDHMRIGWIQESALPKNANVSDMQFSQAQVWTKASSNLTDDPLFSAAAISTIPANTEVTRLATMGTWTYVEWNAANAQPMRGFVQSANLTNLSADDVQAIAVRTLLASGFNTGEQEASYSCQYDPETARWSVVVYVQHKYQTVVWVDDATGEGTIG